MQVCQSNSNVVLPPTIAADNRHASYPVLTFISRDDYNNIQSRNLNVKDIFPLINSFAKPSDKLSILTQEYIKYINNRIHSGVFGLDYMCMKHKSLTNAESAYIEDKFNSEFLDPEENRETYYEILPVTEWDYLVVTENGFIHHLTSTKDNCLAFVLACLRCIDRFNCDKSQLNRLYLNLQFNDGFIDLIRVRTT